MLSESPKDLIPYFFGDTAKTYDKVVSWATFGMDDYWKKEIVSKINNANSILDLACGTGILTRMIAFKFPKSRVIGIDISRRYSSYAEKKPIDNVSFVCMDAEKMNFKKKFDCICSSYIPKYCKPKILIENCVNHLNCSGDIILHDFTYPKSIPIRKLWNLYFVLLPLTGKLIPAWKYALSELPKLIRASKWVNEYIYELDKHGFKVTKQSLTWNSSVILHARRNI